MLSFATLSFKTLTMSEIDFLRDSGSLLLGKKSKLISSSLKSIFPSSPSRISLNMFFSSLSSGGKPIFTSTLFLQLLLLLVINSSEIICHFPKSSTSLPGSFMIFDTSSLLLCLRREKKLGLSIVSALALSELRCSAINSQEKSSI